MPGPRPCDVVAVLLSWLRRKRWSVLPRPRGARRALAFSHSLLNAAVQVNCRSCHTAPTPPVHVGLTCQCTQCHSQDRWKPTAFDHARFFVLERDNTAPCATCHTVNDKRQYTCYGCHEHTEANVRRKHIREGIANFGNRVSCHRSAHGEGREGNAREGGKERKKDNE